MIFVVISEEQVAALSDLGGVAWLEMPTRRMQFVWRILHVRQTRIGQQLARLRR
jgi:hypothetical protein